jgi:hypothetical protein
MVKNTKQTLLFPTAQGEKYQIVHKTIWSPKQKRAYHRIKSGVRVAEIKKKKHLLKHLILTSSPEGGKQNICSDFQTLRKRIQRKFGYLLPYCMVHTNEGNGVLHVLYYGSYLPQKWVSDAWDEIHKSDYIFIKEVPDNVAKYVVTQYIANQQTAFQRCSWSQNWVCRGFVREWKNILRWGYQWRISMSQILLKWDTFLKNICKPKQQTLLMYPP